MDPSTMSAKELMLYGLMINGGIGVVLGLIPLITGFVKRNIKYGLFGFAGSVVGGAILGILLSLPISAIFTWLIVRGPQKPAEVVVVNQEPIDVLVDDNYDQ